MKPGRHLLASLEDCTGCRLCMFACSLRIAGRFSPARSILRILGNDEFARFYPAMSTASCPCADGEELCVRACPHGALRFLDDCDVPSYLRQGSAFVAAPLIDTAGANNGAEGATT